MPEAAHQPASLLLLISFLPVSLCSQQLMQPCESTLTCQISTSGILYFLSNCVEKNASLSTHQISQLYTQLADVMQREPYTALNYGLFTL